jgi:hypothetical protein
VKEYRVDDGRAKFWFVRSGWVWPGTQDSVWAIALWADDPQGARKTWGGAERATWGSIKALFE